MKFKNIVYVIIRKSQILGLYQIKCVNLYLKTTKKIGEKI